MDNSPVDKIPNASQMKESLINYCKAQSGISDFNVFGNVVKKILSPMIQNHPDQTHTQNIFFLKPDIFIGKIRIIVMPKDIISYYCSCCCVDQDSCESKIIKGRVMYVETEYIKKFRIYLQLTVVNKLQENGFKIISRVDSRFIGKHNQSDDSDDDTSDDSDDDSEGDDDAEKKKTIQKKTVPHLIFEIFF